MGETNLDSMDDQPMPELAGLKLQPQDNFLERLHEGVHRRALATQCVDFSLQAFLGYWIAMISMLFEAIGKDANVSREDEIDE